MGRRTYGWMAMTAAVAAVLVGCGSGDDDGDSGAASTAAVATSTAAADETDDGDWCPVTTEQVSAIVRHAVVAGDTCTWDAPDLTAAVLEVYVNGTDPAHLNSSTETVDGIGDAAAFDVSGALVFEHRGGYWVAQIINIGGGSDVVSKDAELELAKLVIDGIG